MTNTLQDGITAAVDALKPAHNICILTGAGISAESGIPTFRDKQTGLWANFRAEDLASIDAFNRDPSMVWAWYQWRRGEVKDKKPNPAHDALASWQQKRGEQCNLTLITQNVDDLHEQAGSTAIHLHGELWKNRCSQCDQKYHSPIDPKNTQLIACKFCGSYIRPDIVWFGEMLPQQAWQRAQAAAMSCEVFISIGTSSLVYPAAGLAQSAKQNGAVIIEINPNPTDSSFVDIQIPFPAGDALPALISQLPTK